MATCLPGKLAETNFHGISRDIHEYKREGRSRGHGLKGCSRLSHSSFSIQPWSVQSESTIADTPLLKTLLLFGCYSRVYKTIPNGTRKVGTLEEKHSFHTETVLNVIAPIRLVITLAPLSC